MTVVVYKAGASVTVVDTAPPPPPPPPDPPPDTSGLGIIVTKSVNMLGPVLMMQGYMTERPGYDPGRYDRQEYTVRLKGTTATYRCTPNNFAAGGAKLAFGKAYTLTLLFDGKPVATKAVLATDFDVIFTVDLSAIPESWYFASVSGLDATWSVLDYPVYVQKGAVPIPQARTPVASGSYTLEMKIVRTAATPTTPATVMSTHHTSWVPSTPSPRLLPLVPRECPAFSELPYRPGMVITQLVHGRAADTYDLCVTEDGLVNTANMQPYNFFTFQQPKPYYPIVAGPRGKARLSCPTHVEMGKAAPTAAEGNALGPIDNAYFTTPWSVGKVRETGEVVVTCGAVHDGLPQYWPDKSNARLAGDWSNIPQLRWGFDELWGMAWRLFAIDLSAAPIPGERNLKPHTFGVQQFVSDQRTPMPNGGIGRVCKLQYSPTSHATPPVVTEFYGAGAGEAMNQCFDVVSNGHDINNPVSDAAFRIWTSNRMGHEIIVLGVDANGAAVVIEKWTGIQQPEGLALFERADGLWLYYVSSVRAGGDERGAIQKYMIRRRHTVTKEDVLIVDCKADPFLSYYINSNTLLGKIAVNSGGCGPKGMIGLATWSNSYYGFPLMIDGETGKFIDMKVGAGGFKGGGNPDMTYTSAVGFSQRADDGRMVWGTACDGLFMMSKPIPTDTVWPASVEAGRLEWNHEGYVEAFGHYCIGNLAPPWDKLNANKTAFLTAHGHIKA